jgi:protein AATF/BFR2
MIWIDRYTVHDPLVNFMAPELMVLPPMATKLFANLFGQQALAPWEWYWIST